MKARFDVDRAALDVVEGDLVARLDYERAKLALDDARQRLKETEAKNRAAQASNAANLAARERRRGRRCRRTSSAPSSRSPGCSCGRRRPAS